MQKLDAKMMKLMKLRIFRQIMENLLGVKRQKIFAKKFGFRVRDAGSHNFPQNFPKTVMMGTSAYKG